MLNRSTSLAMSTSILKALPGKLDIKRHSPSILYFSITLFWIKIAVSGLSMSDWQVENCNIMITFFQAWGYLEKGISIASSIFKGAKKI